MSILIYFATIFWSLFPNLIHVFQSGDNFINKVNETNLVINGDFSDGLNSFIFANNTTDITLVDGVATFTATSQYGRIRQDNFSFNENDLVYYYASVKTTSNLVYFITAYNSPSASIYHSGNGEFEFLSNITTASGSYNTIQVIESGDSDFTPISVDYIGAYNVSTMISNGVKNDNSIQFSYLTYEQIKEQLDIWINEFGSLDFTITKDNTSDQWFDTGFVEKTAERDFLDYLGYFVWLLTPPIILFATLDLLRRVI